MKIELNCVSETCPYSRTCANHITAGDFRSEGGFSPQVIMKNGEYHCLTYHQPLAEQDARWMSRDEYPENYNQLGRGYVSESNIISEKSAAFMEKYPGWCGELPQFVVKDRVILRGSFSVEELQFILELTKQ